jgi:hypothetical protein
MPRRSRTTEELRKAAVHVSYEIDMLGFSAEHLGGWHSSPMTNPVGNEKNMALESFLLHFRNLRAFLCPSSQRDDDVLASDFIGMYDGSDVADRDKLNVDKERLDKMLAHVSYSRPDYIEAGDHGWDSSVMLILILSELRKFLVRLPEQQRPWFPAGESLNEWQHWAQGEVDQRGSNESGL